MNQCVGRRPRYSFIHGVKKIRIPTGGTRRVSIWAASGLYSYSSGVKIKVWDANTDPLFGADFDRNAWKTQGRQRISTIPGTSQAPGQCQSARLVTPPGPGFYHSRGKEKKEFGRDGSRGATVRPRRRYSIIHGVKT